MFYCNIRSINKNFDYIEAHINTQNFEIIALCECWIIKDTHVPHLPGYNCNYIESTYGKSGGIAIYTKNNLKVDRLDLNVEKLNPSTELLSIHILSENLIFTTFYRHPNENPSHFLTDLEDILCNKLFQNDKIRKLICGDFNINTLDVSKISENYLRIIDSFNYNIYAEKPTRITKNSATCIDHVIYQIQHNNKISCTVNNFQASDHHSISISLLSHNSLCSKSNILRRNHSKSNIEKFKNTIKTINWNELMCNNYSIDENLDKFMSKIIQVYSDSFPKITNCKRNDNCIWMNKKIKKMIVHKNYLQRKYKRKNNINNFTKFTRYNTALRREISQAKKEYYCFNIVSYSGKKKWDFINKIRNKPKSLTDVKISANEYKNHLDQIIAKPYTNIPTKNPLNSKICCNTASLYFADENEILNYLFSLKNKSTHHEFDIPMFLWNKIAEEIYKPITYLVNSMISEAYFPKLLKSSIITPIYKRGDRNLPNSYRPISVLHNLSKIFEKVVYTRMNSFCIKYNVIPDYQFGFRPNFSTKDAVTSLLLQIEMNKSNNLKTCCIFLDLSKAFDMVNYTQLLNILNNQGFRGHFQSLLKSYLSDRTYSIKLNNDISSSNSNNCLSNGVPQGSILSPFLYSLYVDNFSSVHNCVIQYADDSTIVVAYQNFDDLQINVSKIEKSLIQFINDRFLVLNNQKTEIVLFGEHSTRTLTFMNVNINTKTHTKFLGIYISSDRKFDTHIENCLIPNIRKHFSFFYNSSKFFDKKTKILLFHSYITSIIIYATPFLLVVSKKKLTQLERIYNRAIKFLFRLPYLCPSSKLPQFTGLPCLSNVIHHYSLSYAYLIFHRKTPALVHSHFVRSNHRNNFILKTIKDKKSISNTLANNWNAQTTQMKHINTHSTFKQKLKDTMHIPNT